MRITAGSARGRPLVAPASAARPTTDRVRLALFSILEALGASMERVLDLYAGSGALGLEALSRGAAWVDFVDQDSRACAVVRGNLATLRLAEQAHVYHMAAQKALLSLREPYTLVFVDPPYDDPQALPVLSSLAGSPLLAPDAIVCWEHSARKEAPAKVGDLDLLRERRYGDTVVTLYSKGGAE